MSKIWISKKSLENWACNQILNGIENKCIRNFIDNEKLDRIDSCINKKSVITRIIVHNTVEECMEKNPFTMKRETYE